MAIFKCKICGGTLEINAGETVATCEYCGTKQTVPLFDDDRKVVLFNRANRLRSQFEFDKAYGIYETIVSDFPEEAEAYWGLVLCKYGIEYVDDKATSKKVPTCHRTSHRSLFEDENYLSTLKYSDDYTRELYKEEAFVIEKLREKTIEISSKEDPYDIFICYKETDKNGERTVDSVIAEHIYDILCEKGYRVFFSRISLEDKIGSAYEPYIFSAINSSSIMLVFGTSVENINSVWVKNEWSRFLQLVGGSSKKTLIPCYKDIDVYDLPEEFIYLQSQNMGKIGAEQDLIRGISKILPLKNDVKETDISKTDNSTIVDSILKRAFTYLEDGMFEKADNLCEQALNFDIENPSAYLGKLMAEFQVRTQEQLMYTGTLLSNSQNYNKILQYGKGGIAEDVIGYNNYIAEQLYTNAIDVLKRAHSCSEIDTAEAIFMSISFYKDSDKKIIECYEKAANIKLKRVKIKRLIIKLVVLVIVAISLLVAIDKYTTLVKYDKAVTLLEAGEYEEAIPLLSEAKNVKDAKELLKDAVIFCNEKRKSNISIGDRHIVGLKDDGTVVAVGDNYNGQCNVEDWTDIVAISVGNDCTVGLKADGTVVAAGYNGDGQCNVEEWTDIVAIYTGGWHTVGLKADGTVVAVGKNSYGQCNVKNWKDIIAISAGYDCTVGLKADGTVVAVGYNGSGQCNVKNWTDIVAISVGDGHIVGLKADGTVVAVGYNGDGQCNVEEWTDIVAISADYGYTVGLKADGTVVAVGDNEFGQCDVEDWTNIVAIYADHGDPVGLKADGTVVTGGYINYVVEEWTDIVAIYLGNNYTVGLKADGTVVTDNYIDYVVEEWDLFD